MKRGLRFSNPLTAAPNVDDLRLQVLQLERRVAELETQNRVLRASESVDGADTLASNNLDPRTDVKDDDRLNFVLRALDLMSMGLNPTPNVASSRRSSHGVIGYRSVRDITTTLFPLRSQINNLLSWAHQWIWWHHCVYHVQTFNQQMAAMWNGLQADGDWGWSAMLFALLSVSAGLLGDL